MTENMQSMLGDWNKIAGKTLLGCESAAAEPFIGNLLYSDNRYELNYQIGVPVPLYNYIYHEYLRNFMGNQVACPLDTTVDTLRYRLGYSFAIGDSMTLVLTPDGELMTHWGTRDFEHHPDFDTNLEFISNLVKVYKTEAKKYLLAGRMIRGPRVKCETVTFKRYDSERVVTLPAVLSSVWEAEDGGRAMVLVNPDTKERKCTVRGKEFVLDALSATVVKL